MKTPRLCPRFPGGMEPPCAQTRRWSRSRPAAPGMAQLLATAHPLCRRVLAAEVRGAVARRGPSPAPRAGPGNGDGLELRFTAAAPRSPAARGQGGAQGKRAGTAEQPRDLRTDSGPNCN